MKNGNIEDIYELTPVQQGMLFHSLYTPDTDVYNIQMDFTLRGHIDPLAFQRAWQRVVDRHSALRTSFAWDDLKQPYQIVHRSVPLQISRHDWRSWTAEQQSAALSTLAREDKLRTFDLKVPPLMRLNLVRLSERDYRFFWTFHHMMAEGWSAAIVLREVSKAFDQYSQDGQVSLEPARPYSDYIRWLQQLDALPAQAYWRRTLAGFAEPNRLPIDRAKDNAPPRVAHCTEVKWRLSFETTQALDQFAKRNRLTLSTIVQGAWALLLGRYTRSSDIVFGVVVSGRSANVPGIESMVGLCVNTLPARVQVDANACLVPWLQALQREQAELRKYEHSPIVQAQSFSDVPHGQPLFETLVGFQNWAGELPQDAWLRKVEVRNLQIHEGSDYPLALLAAPGRQLSLILRYDGQRFREDAVIRMQGHLTTLLEAFTASSEQHLRRMSLLTGSEREQLLVRWNRTAVDYPREVSVAQLFEQQASRSPDALAVAYGEESLTYGELDARSNRLARWLRNHGVGADIPVAVLLERSPAMITAWLGVLKAGGAYVPLDPSYPPSRLEFMLADVGATVLLTTRALAGRAAAYGGEVLEIDSSADVLAAQQATPLMNSATGAENLAYIMYTSGSTGEPKGVAVEHRGLMNLVYWHRRVYEVTADDRATQYAGLSFDASVWEVWPYLTVGASVHLLEDEVRHSPARLLSWLAAQRITLSFLPTPIAEAVLREPFPTDLALRVLLTGGDRLRGGVPETLPFRLVNHYGPTENTVVSTCAEVDPEDALPPIGRPIDNVCTYVLDEYGNAVPVGVAGELYLGGDGLARGYWNRPELTAEKFVVCPFDAKEGTRLYRTGDLVRYRSDGALEFLGRVDQQVKLRGFRIELGEVEAVLAAQAGIRETAVLCREDAPGEKRLVAYVTETPGAELAVAALREALSEKLPDYMVPSAFVVLDALPLTPNGKLDRRALPAPEHFVSEASYVAPRTPTEEIVAGIWADLLRLERVGATDNFFALGGHSLLATQVVSRACEQFKLRIPLKAIFEEPTLAGFADYIAMLDWSRQAREEGATMGAVERIRI